LSIAYAEDLSIKELGNFHIFLYKKNDEFILKQVQTTTVSYDTHVDFVHYELMVISSLNMHIQNLNGM
jgi:hypothetical protein